jgi:hypothetical protein
MEWLTSPESADFNPHRREVYLSVKKRFFVNMPPSVGKGDQGANAVRFRVSQNGPIPEDSLKTARGSGKSDLDGANLPADREAAPLSHRLEKLSRPITLRFTF